MKLNKEPEKSNDKKYLFITELIASVGLLVIAFFVKHLIDLLQLVDLLSKW